jgi:mono/diheme cytochrome c family protein
MQKNLRANQGAFVIGGNARSDASNTYSAVDSGSISSGHQIAITICGNCHEVPASSQTAVSPKLEDIANRPSTTALSLKSFLVYGTKKRIPNFILSMADTNDMIAYVLSFKRK